MVRTILPYCIFVGFGTNPVNDLVIGFIVSGDRNFIEVGERSFNDTDFKINRVVYRPYLDRIDIREQITIVLVQVGNIVSVGS
jgi:uncharacterized protein (UPF0297 family)